MALPRIIGLALTMKVSTTTSTSATEPCSTCCGPAWRTYEHVRLRDELTKQRSLLGRLLEEQGTTVIELDDRDPAHHDGLARLAWFFEQTPVRASCR